MSREIAVLEKLGSRWQKNGMDRIYFNGLDKWIGLDCGFYNTGNVSSATLNDEHISNSLAREMLGQFATGKLWFEPNTGKWIFKGIAREYALDMIEAIEKAADEVVL